MEFTWNTMQFLTFNLLKLDVYALIFSCTTKSLTAWLLSAKYHFKYTNPTFTCAGDPKLVKPICHSNKTANNLFFHHIDLWNSLPYTITHAFISEFKRQLLLTDLHLQGDFY